MLPYNPIIKIKCFTFVEIIVAVVVKLLNQVYYYLCKYRIN